jgi:exopolysaccharide biosynthesis polyprenyl glycosylphosphotransferase
MGRAIVHYVPRAVPALALTECLLSFMVVYMLHGLPSSGGQSTASSALAATMAFAIGGTTLVMSGQTSGVYLGRRHLLCTALIAGLVALPLMSAVQGVFSDTPFELRSVVLTWGIWLFTIAIFRGVLGIMADRARPVQRILMIGEPDRIVTVSTRLVRARNTRIEPVTGNPAVLSCDLMRQHGISTVVVSGAVPPDALQALLDCKLRGIAVVSDLAFQERALGRIDLDTVRADDIVFADGFADGAVSQGIKRISDVAIAIAMLVAMLPLMVFTAIAIKADSLGPVLYRQQRVGRLGHTFTLYKFRSMAVDAEAAGPSWAQHADPRVTRVGSFIRATRIDELPQLANVLLGQMSVVGPRPERPHFVQQLAAAIPFYHERSYVKPGVTGWAQVNYPYGASIEDAREKLAFDLFYVKHHGLWLDLVILLSTIRVVLFREGAR